MELYPSQIRYSLESISPYFDAKGRYWDQTVHDMIEEMTEKRVAQIPEIQVQLIGNQWVTEDNHRLWVFRNLQRQGICGKIPVTRPLFDSNKEGKSFANVRLEIRKPEDRIQKFLDEQKKADEEMLKKIKEKKEKKKKQRAQQRGKKGRKGRKGKAGRRKTYRPSKSKAKVEQQKANVTTTAEEVVEWNGINESVDEEFKEVVSTNAFAVPDPNNDEGEAEGEREEDAQDEGDENADDLEDDGDNDDDDECDDVDDEDDDDDEENLGPYDLFRQRFQNNLQEMLVPNVGNFGSMVLSIVLGLWLFNNLEKSGMFGARGN